MIIFVNLRCGMIFLDPSALGHELLLNAWLNHHAPKFLSKQQTTIIKILMDTFIEKSIDFVERQEQFIKCSSMQLILSFLKLFYCFLEEMKKAFDEKDIIFAEGIQDEDESTNEADDLMPVAENIFELDNISNSIKTSEKSMEERNNMIICYFYLSVVWSIGSVLKKDSREKFNFFFLDLIEKFATKHPKPKEIVITKEIILPKRQSIYNLIYTRNHNWTTWASMIEPCSIPPNIKVTSITNDAYLLHKRRIANKILTYHFP